MMVNGIEVIRDAREAAHLLQGDTEIAADLETSGLVPHKEVVAVINLYGQQTDTLAVVHCRGKIPPEMKELLENKEKRFTWHNGVTFDIPFLLESGVDATKPKIYDTMVGAGIAITTDRAGQSKSLQAEINRRLQTYIPKGADHSSWMNKELDQGQILYCADDLLHIHALREEQQKKTQEQGQFSALALEMAIVGSVARMTFNGLPLSIAALDDFRDTQRQYIGMAEAEITNRFGPVNVNSSEQIKAVMRGMGMKVPTLNTRKKDKETGRWTYEKKESTSADLLGAIIQRGVPGLVAGGYITPEPNEHPKLFAKRAEIVIDSLEKIIGLREATKRVDMYDDAWCEKFRSKRGRIHARFRQAGTATLRFSASEPNLQQWPKNMRGVIGGEEGMSIVSSDYSQIEVVIAAELAQDGDLLSLIEQGGDIHRMVAAMCLNKNESAVTSDERRVFKAANFCLIFGGKPQTFMEYALQYGAVLTYQEAEQIHSLYFRRFRGLARAVSEAEALAKSGRKIIEIRLRSGGVRHLMGDSLKSTTILNTQVQGNAAAGMKYAILECKKKGLDKSIGATVHDELVGVVSTRWAEEYAKELQACMIRGMGKVLHAPCNTEAKVAPFWS